MKGKRTGENNPFYGKHHTDEAKERMSKALSGENHPNYGKHLSEEHKKKLSEAKKNMSDETRNKIAEAKKGKHWKLVDGKRVWY